MTYSQGALVEPISVAYHGIERANLKLGEGVLIAGAGPIGLVALLLAKASGCTPLNDYRFQAKKNWNLPKLWFFE